MGQGGLKMQVVIVDIDIIDKGNIYTPDDVYIIAS